jgi:hypothetical protein
MKPILTFVFIMLTLNSLSQFKIITDETYEPKLRSAINLMREADAGYYCLFIDYTSQIRISSDSIPKQFSDGVMNVPLRVVSAPSMNNLASWMVNQSYRLRLDDVAKNLSKNQVDSLCFRYEQNFRRKLPREYGTSFKERMRQFFDFLLNDPYENYVSQESTNSW